MNTASLDFDNLRCTSLIRMIEHTEPQRLERALPFGKSTVHIVSMPDVLYVPALGLQVVQGKIVPQESVPQPWTFEFETARKFQGKADAYRRPFRCEASGQTVCILANFYSRNFFHWLTEELVKVAILERHGFSGHYIVHKLPNFATEFLAIMGIARERIIDNVSEPTIYRSAVFTTPIDSSAARAHEDIYLALREALLSGAGPEKSNLPDRLWMDRGAGVNNKGRELVNTEEVHAILGRHGFEVMDMAKLPVAGQIAAAHNARVLSGPHGAAFAHTLFMKPKGAVIECFSPLFINPGAFEICHIMQHRYSMLVHELAYAGYPHGQNVKVNCAHLELVLQGLA